MRDLVESGVESLTVGLVNSYVSGAHEEQIGAVIERLYPGFPVTLSSEVLPEFREYERTLTACMNSYVRPKVATYVEQLQSQLAGIGAQAEVNILRSDAGLMTTKEAARNPIYGILRAPPAASQAGCSSPGRRASTTSLRSTWVATSTDVALCQNGQPTIGRETSISHFRIKVPSVNVHTVGAGGGSIAHVPELTKALRVGPQSAGADPGPAAYGKGGTEPTVTDANVVLGHLPPRLLGGEMELDVEAARAAVQTVADAMGLPSVEAAAEGILAIVNENMAGALRLVSVQRGHDPREFALVATVAPALFMRTRSRRSWGHSLFSFRPHQGFSAPSETSLQTSAMSSPARTFASSPRPTRLRSARFSTSSAAAQSHGWMAKVSPRARAAFPSPQTALPGTGLRDSGCDRPGRRPHKRPRGPRRTLQRAPRAAVRLPHARHGDRDCQPASGRVRRRAEARASGGRGGQCRCVERRRRTSTASSSRAEPLRRRSTTGRG